MSESRSPAYPSDVVSEDQTDGFGHSENVPEVSAALARQASETSEIAKPSVTKLGVDASKVSGGLELALPCLVFTLGGLWLDRVFGFTPVLTIVGSVLGFVGASLNVYYRYVAEMDEHEKKRLADRAELVRQTTKTPAASFAANLESSKNFTALGR